MEEYNLKDFEIIESSLLKGHEIAIKSGKRLYVWPDFNFPDVFKVFDAGDMESELIKPVKIDPPDRPLFFSNYYKSLIGI